MAQVMSLAQMQAFLSEHFPQGEQYGVLVDLGDGWAEMELPVADQHLRPGGTISGPTMMALADVAMYAALLSRIGPVELAVTINLNINFLRKPAAETDLRARAEVLKVGKRLGVGEVYLASRGSEDPVAHATLTYSIPEQSV